MNRRNFISAALAACAAPAVPVLKPRSVGASTLAADLGERRFVHVFDFTQGKKMVLWYHEKTAVGNLITTTYERRTPQ